MQVDLKEFRSAYVVEAEEHLGAIQTLLLDVERAIVAGRSAPRELRELMRLLHTVKGLSAMVGVDPIVTLTHAMEALVRGADRAGGRIGNRALEALLAGAREAETRVRAVSDDRPVPPPPSELLTELDALDLPEGDEDAAPEALAIDAKLAERLSASEREQLLEGTRAGRRAVRVDFAPSPESADRDLTITTVRERIARVGDIVKVVPLTSPPSPAAPSGLVFAILLLTTAADEAIADAAGLAPESVSPLLDARPTPIPTRPREATAEPEADVPRSGGAVLRVEVARVDETIERLSALIVTRSRLLQALATLRESGADVRELQAIVVDNARQLRDLRAALLRVRMVPMATVLERLPLVVRGIARATNKSVELAIADGGAELDKSVAERLFPALVHLVRNAVDHGIEAPAQRTANAKPPQGTIALQCAPRSQMVEIRIADDGAGIDREAVAKRAGVEGPLDDGALLDLLCQSGLSTRGAADTTSGRGVGMDIVKKVVVEGLGGELAVESTRGHGTTFVLRVPLTIAIVDAFKVQCGGQRFVVPVSAVEEIVELEGESLVTMPREADLAGSFFVRRDEAIALVDLARAFALDTSRAPRQALIVRRGHHDPVAFGVDRVVGQEETVVRPLGDPLVAVPGVSGSTDLGDGRATLVLDLPGLAATTFRRPARQAPTRLLASAGEIRP